MGQDEYPRTFTNLSVPSVIFADASWYGSLRGGVELGGDADGRFSTTGSRWGIQGSSEVSEGLTAVYKFETRVGSGSSASQGTNQLYAGLSGGFGSLTLGKFHNAAYNGAGAIRDIGWWYSSGDTASKVGNTVSYAFSSDAANFQVDAIMDSAKDSGRAIDEVQFGVSVNLGNIGKVGLGYENVEDWEETKTVTTYALANNNVNSNFVGDFTVPSSDVAGGLEAEITFMLESTYARARVPTGQCLNAGGTDWATGVSGAANGGQVTQAACFDENNGGSSENQWEAHSSFTTDDASMPWVLTEEFESDLGIDLAGDSPMAQLMSVTGTGDDQMPVDNKVVLVHQTDNFDATSDAPVITALDRTPDGSTIVNSVECVEGGEDDDFGDCVPVRIFFTIDDEGDEQVVPGNAPDHLLNIRLNDGSLTAGSADDITDTRTIESEVEDTTVVANPAGKETTPMHGYQATHVSVQLNLGAMTLGLGYSEKESNKMGSMDQKTTFLGASGSIGDTGMGWRAWTRDISNVDNAKGDANPWGIGINKDLGGGAFTFVEHHNADGAVSGNTIVALGVNF